MRIFLRLLLSLFIFTSFSIPSISQIYSYEIGISHGFTALIKNQGEPSLFLPKSTLSFCYYPDLKNGIRTGLSYYNNIEGSNRIFEIPIYYSHKTRKERRNEIHQVNTISGLIFEVISVIIPSRVEFNVGPSVGFINRYNDYYKVSPASNQFFSNEFVADKGFILSIDAGVKPSFVIGRVTITLGFGVGYLISKNFQYTTDDSNFMGYRPRIQLKGDIGIGYSF